METAAEEEKKATEDHLRKEDVYGLRRRPNYCLRTTKKTNNSKPLDPLTPKPQRTYSL